jgi:hypothetical protein
MEYQLQSDGLCPIIFHNERLLDPLDDFTIAIAAVSKKRNKTNADHETIARLEFFGGFYTKPALTLDSGELVQGDNGHAVVGVPAWNILRCLQDGATRQKRGKDVLRGVHPLTDFIPLQYDGPQDVVELFEDGEFSIRKAVGIQRARTMRTRPMFVEWSLVLPVEVDMTVFDVATLRTIWRDAGIYAGTGEMRPVYGRFTGTVVDPRKKGKDEGEERKAA